ncbi:MAG: hypothetical protein K1X94_13320 [Sandaracinaceae bacterium]|nr:hypothetical protein [Sandaracinaceae bacterium]
MTVGVVLALALGSCGPGERLEDAASSDAGPRATDTVTSACVARCEACSLWMCPQLCETSPGACIAASSDCDQARVCIMGPSGDAGP